MKIVKETVKRIPKEWQRNRKIVRRMQSADAFDSNRIKAEQVVAHRLLNDICKDVLKRRRAVIMYRAGDYKEKADELLKAYKDIKSGEYSLAARGAISLYLSEMESLVSFSVLAKSRKSSIRFGRCK